MRNTFFRFISLITSTLLVSTIALAFELPNQPQDPNAGYIVKWDCSANNGEGGFAASNSMEWDENFVFAIDISGTQLADWVHQGSAKSGFVCGVGAEIFIGREDNNVQLNVGEVYRLWNIRDDIWGATYNYEFFYPPVNPTRGSTQEISLKIFGFESPTAHCATGRPETGAWWVGQGGQDTHGRSYTWSQGFCHKAQKNYFFKFAPYTGTKTNRNAPGTLDAITPGVDDDRNIYIDHGARSDQNYKVHYSGYASPFSSQSGACYVAYTQDYDVTALSSTVCPIRQEKATVKLSGSQTICTYMLYQDDQPVAGSEKTGTGSALTWTVEEEGVYTVYALKNGETQYAQMLPCSGNSSVTITTEPNCKEPECPKYTWTIDGNQGIATPMYPGGWYEVTCTCEAGAPTVAITGTGVTTQGQTVNGNTVTLRVELSGSATGEMQFAAKNNANTALDFKACGDTLHPTIATCEGATAETWKIEWHNWNGTEPRPDLWIANGASVYLRDNGGKLEADVAHSDGQDEWLFIATGEQKHGEPVYYIRNGLTRRYLHRGTQHGNIGGDWEYAEAKLDATLQAADDNYKWVLYPYNGDTIFACVADFNSTTNIDGHNGHSDNPYVLHTRLWEAASLFNNPLVTKPGVVCGKMADQAGSPVFYMKHREHPQVSGVAQTTQLQWNGTVSTDTIVVRTGDKLSYTAQRSDNVHSINEAIHYESSNPSGFAVDAATGAVEVKSTTPGDTATIFAILESVGCFAGDTIRYALRVYDCRREEITHQDHQLPHQPQTEDCEYIVLWDCNANNGLGDWAEANTMEWGETFTLAINLAGTPLGNWVMQQPTTPSAVRTVAFDRLLKKEGDDQSEHFALDVSRMWLIRDTIFGATYNFKQIPLVNGQFYTPKTNEQTGIAVRLFGVEAAHADQCGNAASVSKWWQWSDNSNYSEWGGQWQQNTYVSEDNQYLFRFAPYTGKSDPVYNAQVDDPRDRWYDAGHDFSSNGYSSPCPAPWPQNQALTLDKTTICDTDGETATLTMAGSETDWNYTLYNNGTAVNNSTQAGSGAALSWTLSAAGTYTVVATGTDGGHTARMDSCNTKGERSLTIYCEPDPECAETQYQSLTDYVCDTLLPYTWQTYRTVSITKDDLTADGIYHDTLYTTLANGEKCTTTVYKLVLRVDICEPLPVEPEERVTEPDAVCAGDQVTLVADSLGHKYLWSTGATTDRIQVTPTTPGTEEYTLRVYDTRRQTSANLMANGDFENYTDYHQAPTGFSSDYEYLPFSPTGTDLYLQFKDKNGVYLLSSNAQHTWRDYANVGPHGGDYFAMFDAAQSGAAWRVTTDDNPHMTLRQGAKYIFSYWAADLNEANQRQNPAELQFSINYKNDANGQMTKEYLGQKMTLGKDNKWHYYEVVWTAPCNASYLEISVEDLNNVAGVGNDFGLDDIIFQMINGEAEYTVDKQRFVLTVEDCTEPEPCQEVAYRKWNDLIFVDNSGNEFVSYQWFADGMPIPGATAQYYYSENIPLAGDGHSYHCEMMTVGGKLVTTCAHPFDEFNASVAGKKQVAPISCTVFTVGGALIRWGADRSIVNDLPAGYYLLRTLMTDGTVLTEKHVIR